MASSTGTVVHKSMFMESKQLQPKECFIFRSHTNTHLHVGDEGHLLQRLFSSGPMAESHPLQSHCHSGSKAGSGPKQTKQTNKQKNSHKNEWEIVGKKICKKWSNPPLFDLVLLPHSCSCRLHLNFKQGRRLWTIYFVFTCFCYISPFLRYCSF